MLGRQDRQPDDAGKGMQEWSSIRERRDEEEKGKVVLQIFYLTDNFYQQQSMR